MKKKKTPEDRETCQVPILLKDYGVAKRKDILEPEVKELAN